VDYLTDPYGAGQLDWDVLDWGVSVLRIVLGYIFLDSGLGKFRRGISGTGNWFAGLGMPAPQLAARLVASLELFGGMLLIAGLFTHWIAIPLAFNMLVATYVQRFKLHAPFQGGDVQGYELDVLMVAGSVTLVLAGAGTFSLDELLTG
jgi:putative oxidoreductase